MTRVRRGARSSAVRNCQAAGDLHKFDAAPGVARLKCRDDSLGLLAFGQQVARVRSGTGSAAGEDQSLGETESVVGGFHHYPSVERENGGLRQLTRNARGLMGLAPANGDRSESLLLAQVDIATAAHLEAGEQGAGHGGAQGGGIRQRFAGENGRVRSSRACWPSIRPRRRSASCTLHHGVIRGA